MLTRAFDRGHLDNRAPAFRIVLHAQPAPLAQAALFASIEPNTEPPCDHPEAGWQTDIFGDCVYCCTFCGAELPEPVRNADKKPCPDCAKKPKDRTCWQCPRCERYVCIHGARKRKARP